MLHELQLRFLNIAARAEPKLFAELAEIATAARILKADEQPGEVLVVAVGSGLIGVPAFPQNSPQPIRETIPTAPPGGPVMRVRKGWAFAFRWTNS